MMEIFKNINDAPYPPRKTPFTATRIRLMHHPRITEDLAREPTSNLLCTVCPKPGHLTCLGCGHARYCSRECQVVDHSTHKFFCKSFDRFTDDKRPSPLHIRAILFPEDKKKPEWTWVLRNDDRTAVSLSHLYKNLPRNGLTELTPVTYMNCQTSRMPHHWLTSLALCQTSRGERASSINKSVMKLGPPGHLHTYWGPLIVVAGKPEPADPGDPYHPDKIIRVEDVEMEDVWPVIEVMLYGDRDSPCVVNVPRYPHKSLPAIKINCFGDRARFHAATFESVTVPNKEPIAVPRQYPCILPFLLGLPWLCRTAISTIDFCNVRGQPDPWLLANPELGDVHSLLKEHGSEHASTLAGFPRPHVSPTQPCNIEIIHPPGTLVLLHAFGEPILAEHVKIVSLFIRETRVNKTWFVPGSGYKTFNRDVFRKFWDDTKAANDVPGADLTDVPSPYAWEGRPREEDKYVKGFDEFKSLLKDAVTDVFFDNVFRGGRTSPLAGHSEAWTEEYFDPLN